MGDQLQGTTYFALLAGYAEAKIEGGHCRKIRRERKVDLMPRITTKRTLGSANISLSDLNLEAGANYTVRLRAMNAKGNAENFSMPYNFQTLTEGNNNNGT